MRAGLDIARLWMEGPGAVFNVQGRTDTASAGIMQVCLQAICALLSAALLSLASLLRAYMYSCQLAMGVMHVCALS